MTAEGTPTVGPVREVTAVLTADCNLRCRYCCIRRTPGRAARWPTLRRTLTTLLPLCADQFQFAFTGGEPLLESATLKRAVRHAERIRPAHEIQWVVLTNGMLLDDPTIAFLESRRFAVALSLDGIPAAQKHRGAGTVRHLERLLDRLRRDHQELFRHRLSISVTLCPDTVQYLADSIEYLLEKDVSAVTVAPVMGQSGWRLSDLDGLSRQFDRVFGSIRARYRQTGAVPLTIFRKTCAEQPPVLSRWLCGAPTGDSLTVDVDGVVHACLLATALYGPGGHAATHAAAALRIGRTADPRFMTRLKGLAEAARSCGVFEHAERRHSSYGRCEGCPYVARCRICPFAAAAVPGCTDLDRVPDFQCAYNQVSLAARDRFPCQPSAHDFVTGRAPGLDLGS